MPETLLDALEVIARQQAMINALQRHVAWADGRRGDGVARAPGLTDTMMHLLRRFAACGVVAHAEFEDLHRQVSLLRKRLKAMAPGVVIVTLKRIGYEVVAGFEDVYRILRSAYAPRLTVGDFTATQTVMLRALASRGSIHIDSGKAIGRHMSNIRAKLNRAGVKVAIATHAGEGLYTLDDAGRRTLGRFLSGELEPQASFQPARQLMHKQEVALMAA